LARARSDNGAIIGQRCKGRDRSLAECIPAKGAGLAPLRERLARSRSEADSLRSLGRAKSLAACELEPQLSPPQPQLMSYSRSSCEHGRSSRAGGGD
jgi:hypothetical protein